MSVRFALGAMLGLYFLGGIMAWQLHPLFFGILAFYVVQNVAYTAYLKQFLFVDLFCISTGFVLRAIAGVILVSAVLSPWLLLCTFLTALLFGVSKRWGERRDVADPETIRSTLGGYSPRLLQFLFGSVATLLLLSYSLYTFFARDLIMMVTIPFAFYAVFRFAHLTFANDGLSEPGRLLLDRPMVANLVVWTTTTMLILYIPRSVLGI